MKNIPIQIEGWNDEEQSSYWKLYHKKRSKLKFVKVTANKLRLEKEYHIAIKLLNDFSESDRIHSERRKKNGLPLYDELEKRDFRDSQEQLSSDPETTAEAIIVYHHVVCDEVYAKDKIITPFFYAYKVALFGHRLIEDFYMIEEEIFNNNNQVSHS